MSVRGWTTTIGGAIAAIPKSILQKLEDGLSFLVSFFNEHDALGGKGSMTRICAFAFMSIAIYLGVTVARIALAHWADANAKAMVTQVGIVAAMFVSSGCVALLLRSKAPPVDAGSKDANG